MARQRNDLCHPSSATASARMRRVSQKGTRAELLLRRLLFSRGLRYRVQIPLLTHPRRVADLAFVRERVAVFVDGCFWHGCPEHSTWPKSNADFWREKILANRRRDRETDELLGSADWEVIRIWAHSSPDDAAALIEGAVRRRRAAMESP